MLIGAALRALADVTGMAFPFVPKMKFIFIIFFLDYSSSRLVLLCCTFETDRGRINAVGHIWSQKITWLRFEQSYTNSEINCVLFSCLLCYIGLLVVLFVNLNS